MTPDPATIMTDPDAELVEAMARAMAREDNAGASSSRYEDMARAALRAYREKMVVL